MRYGLGFNDTLTSNAQRTTFMKSSSPPQTSSVDVVKTKGRKPRSKQGGKTPSVSLAKKTNTFQSKPKGEPKGKLTHKGQTPKKHHTQKQKNLRQRTSSSNIQCHYCLKHGNINVFAMLEGSNSSMVLFMILTPKDPSSFGYQRKSD